MTRTRPLSPVLENQYAKKETFLLKTCKTCKKRKTSNPSVAPSSCQGVEEETIQLTYGCCIHFR